MNFWISNKSILGKLLRFPLRLIPNNMALPILLGKSRRKKWIVHSSNHSFWFGSFEYAKQCLFSKAISSGDIVYDIGAHVGFYTLLAAELVGKDGAVVAFEPLPRNLQYLKKHIQLNNYSSNATVIDAAVSDTSGTAFFEKVGHAMGHLSSTGQLTVKQVSLDDLITKKIIPVPSSCIKMDIEGGEFLALQGARSMLTRYHPVIFLSTHGQNVHRKCCRFLSDLGYSLKSITGDIIDVSDEIIAYTSQKSPF